MKRLLQFAILLTSSLLLFSSCDKTKESALSIEKTWKFTLEAQVRSIETPVPLKKEEREEIIYLSFSGGGVIIGQPAKEYAEYYNLPEYKDHILILGAGAYREEKLTETSGKLTIVGLPINYGETLFFTYRDLTKTSMTLVIPGEPGKGETSIQLTAVIPSPKFITIQEFEKLLPEE